MKLLHVSIGLPKTIQLTEGTLETGIWKQEVEDCLLKREGFVGDGVADTRFHGGVDRAVCVYSLEHYSMWEKQFGGVLPRPAFGENLTVSGMTEATTYIGDIYQIGEAVVQVTQGRVPCMKIDHRTGYYGLMADIVRTGYTGYFMRVLQEGVIRKNAPITLLERGSIVTVLEANQLFFHGPWEKEAIERVIKEPALAEQLRNKLLNRLEKA